MSKKKSKAWNQSNHEGLIFKRAGCNKKVQNIKLIEILLLNSSTCRMLGIYDVLLILWLKLVLMTFKMYRFFST